MRSRLAAATGGAAAVAAYCDDDAPKKAVTHCMTEDSLDASTDASPMFCVRVALFAVQRRRTVGAEQRGTEFWCGGIAAM